MTLPPLELMNAVISQTSKGIVSLIDVMNKSNDIKLQEIIQFLQEDINVIKNDLSELRLADLKTAKQNFTVGLEQYLKAAEVSSTSKVSAHLFQSPAAHGGNDLTCWKDTLVRASVAANDAYNRVKTPQEKIECFWIICSCAIATDSPLDACIRIRSWINNILNDDETIRNALKELYRCVYEKNTKMALETKDLLSSLFKHLRGALVALFYYYEKHTSFGHEQKNNLIRVMRKFPYLYEATKQPNKWKHIKVYHSRTKSRTLVNCSLVVPLLGGMVSTAASTVTFGKVKTTMPTERTSAMDMFDEKVLSTERCGIILESGHFLNGIFYKNDFSLEADMIKWLPTTQLKDQKKYCFWMMCKSTLPKYKSTEWYCSLFAASFTILGSSYFLFSYLRHIRGSKSDDGLISNGTSSLVKSGRELISDAAVEVRKNDYLAKLFKNVKTSLHDAATIEAKDLMAEQEDV